MAVKRVETARDWQEWERTARRALRQGIKGLRECERGLLVLAAVGVLGEGETVRAYDLPSGVLVLNLDTQELETAVPAVVGCVEHGLCSLVLRTLERPDEFKVS